MNAYNVVSRPFQKYVLLKKSGNPLSAYKYLASYILKTEGNCYDNRCFVILNKTLVTESNRSSVFIKVCNTCHAIVVIVVKLGHRVSLI